MPRAGDIIGEYILEEKIGEGEFGEVWKARHKEWTDEIVAFKFISSPQLIQNIKKEAKIQHKLEHPNIVKVHGIDLSYEPPYIRMEFVKGKSLREILQEKRSLEPAQVENILLQILSSLDYAHSQGIIHEDLKPENILVSDQGQVKLTDFGLGKVTAEAARSIQLSRQTESQYISGTIPYMAPEKLEGLYSDHRADLYSVAVIMFEMLTGRRPRGIELPRQVVATLSSKWDDVFKKGYCGLERRFRSAREMAEAIKTTSTSAEEVQAIPVEEIPLRKDRTEQISFGLEKLVFFVMLAILIPIVAFVLLISSISTVVRVLTEIFFLVLLAFVAFCLVIWVIVKRLSNL